ncbi:MAG: extracellular solute-binding protein [Kiritimatiellae bacterium]|nr:extracellular solute-binding protein [Kiritimatiellia bacterium]
MLRLPFNNWPAKAACALGFARIPALVLCGCCALSALSALPAPAVDDMITVSFLEGYDPDTPEAPVTRQMLKLVQEEPRLNPQKWGGLTLPGGGGRAPFMLSMAGGSAPDLYYCWFHVIRHDIDQGFIYPLNEWIGDDLNGDGRIDNSEAHWEGWKSVPELWRQVAVKDGKIYGMPLAGTWYYGIVYRKDLVQQAGLEPDYIPETWDDFYKWCQRLTFPGRKISGAQLERGQRAFGVENRPWAWLPWMQSAGGSPVVNVRVSPQTGIAHCFAMEETSFIVPDTGEDLSQVEGLWQADFGSQEAIAAAGFLHQLLWAPWLRDPTSGAPVNLTPAEVAAGSVVLEGGRWLDFSAADVVKGVSRALPRLNSELPQLFERGEVVAVFSGAELVEQLTRDLNLPAEMIGIMPIPAARPGMKPVFQAHKHFYSMTEGVARRSKEERDMVWKCLQRVTSSAVQDEEVRQKVLEGHARWCNPDDLKRMGFDEYLAEVPAGIRRNYERVAAGEILARTEPYAGFWQAVSDLISRRLLGMLLAETGEHFDYAAALRSINEDANRGLMFDVPEEEMQKRRPIARVIFGVALMVLCACFALIIKESRAEAAAGGTGVRINHGSAPLLMLAPALISIALWSYYPLIRGAIMAFQSYKIVGESSWAGIDNFIMVATDSGFWAAWGRTLVYVSITLVLGFLAPVLLALMLTEIPRGKVFFRTLFFLPQLTSALVITLLWKLMYDPTENGMLNQLLAGVGIASQSWLQDPSLAMLCCILPGVWAGAGMASLIYVAALQSLPQDYYEAAAIDGAGIMRRFRHITMPQLLPLMVINFVGAFIAAFQGMGSIFLLTFGGPGDATNVLSLAIWKEAYNNLRFSTATTMAWFLGVALIGFTYLQIRILRKVEFRRANTN